MLEFTPPEADVRFAYAHHNGPYRSPEHRAGYEAAFDRWLAEHDRQVAERVIAWFEESDPNGVTFDYDIAREHFGVRLPNGKGSDDA